MSKIAFITALMFIICLVASFFLRQEKKPVAFSGALHASLGKVTEGETLTHRFKLANKSGRDLHLNLKSHSCRCTSTSVTNLLVAKDADVEIEVKVGTDGKTGKSSVYSLYTFGTEGELEMGQLQLSLDFNVEPLPNCIYPFVVDMPALLVGRRAESPITIRLQKSVPVADLARVTIIPKSGDFNAEDLQFSLKDTQAVDEYTLRSVICLDLQKDVCSPRPFSAELTFRGLKPAFTELRLQIRGTVIPSLQTSPSVISWGLVKDTDNPSSVVNLIDRITNQVVEVLSVECDQDTLDVALSDVRSQFVVKLKKENLDGLDSNQPKPFSRILQLTSKDGRKVDLPVSCLVSTRDQSN